jgi:predicted XRE-type DNA-binding protein
MKWNASRIKRLLNVYRVTQFELADYLGVERSRISHMMNEEFNFNSYSEMLNAFFKAKQYESYNI